MQWSLLTLLSLRAFGNPMLIDFIQSQDGHANRPKDKNADTFFMERIKLV